MKTKVCIECGGMMGQHFNGCPETPDPVEQIFEDIAKMKMTATECNSEPDPFESEEYQRFVESMVPYCHCKASNCPCDGVLAGGLCDGITDDERECVFDDAEE